MRYIIITILIFLYTLSLSGSVFLTLVLTSMGVIIVYGLELLYVDMRDNFSWYKHIRIPLISVSIAAISHFYLNIYDLLVYLGITLFDESWRIRFSIFLFGGISSVLMESHSNTNKYDDDDDTLSNDAPFADVDDDDTLSNDDSEMSDWEKRLAGKTNSSEYEYDTSSESPPSEDKAYDSDKVKFGTILGLKGKVNKSDIHKAYKKKMKEYHPDKVSTMADELQELALKRTKEINKAYEYFKNKYDE